MQKTVARILTVILLLTGTQVFAQFGKNAAAAGVNSTKLQRMLSKIALTDLRLSPTSKALVVSVPKGTVPGNQTLLTRATVQSRSVFNSPASASLVRYVVNMPLGADTLPQAWVKSGGKGFYADQSALARSLDTFYKGKAEVRIGPDGRKVKLYMLPVDGILYKPQGYTTPVLLDAQDYFVIYDIQSQTGKIAEHRSEAYQSFKLSVYDEIWQAMGASKEFDDLNNLCDAILLAHLHKARLDSLPAVAEIKTLVKEGKSEVYQQLNDQEKLLSYIKGLPKVRMAQRNYNAYIVELPVDGLTLMKRDGTQETYNMKDHIMLFFEMGSSVGIFPRTILKDSEIFEVPVASRLAELESAAKPFKPQPQNFAWYFYEAEKLAWISDRKARGTEGSWREGEYPYHFASQEELGKTLDSYHRREVVQARNKATQTVSYVYEIPVSGLTIGENATSINPDKYVLLYNVQAGGELVKRADLENAVLYEFLK